MTRVMPPFNVGFVTARDEFVVDFEPTPIRERIIVFRKPESEMPTSEIQTRFRLKDTTRWNLKEARETLRRDAEWEKSLRNFHIGGYQVCEKWLKDRKGRTLSADENLHDLDTANDGTFFMSGNNGMVLQSADTRPRFTGLRVLADRCVMESDPGLAEGRLRLETSEDLRNWSTAATNVISPVEVPVTNAAALPPSRCPVSASIALLEGWTSRA